MYKAALVALKPERENQAAMRQAISLALKDSLQLSALAVVDPDIAAPRQAVPLGAAAFKEHRDDVIKQKRYEDALAVLNAFSGLCDDAGIKCTTSHSEGHLDDEFGLATQSADILVIGHGGGAEAGSEAREDLIVLDKILTAIARPCLLVPSIPSDIDRVTVAYDGSVQSARAIYDFALSGLWRTAKIDVVAIFDDTASAESIANTGAAYLQLHGYDASAHPILTKYDVAENLVKFIADSGSKALVMGAYGMPRWREVFVGSVTRSVLRDVMVPVFISH
ncbi:MAG: universal stress protein [Thermoleophilia bacterium]